MTAVEGAQPDQSVVRSRIGMGTVITHKIYGMLAEQALLAAERETARLEGMLSRFLPQSDISKINASSGLSSVKVSCETFEVLTKATQFSRICDGHFDVTIGPLVELWSVGKKASEPPSASGIRKALSLVDYGSLGIDPAQRMVSLAKKGQSIDLGGIAKGFAADRVLMAMRKFGIQSAFTDFGGNVATIGAKPDGSPWRVGIRHPRRENELIGAISVIGKSVVTSGDDQRFFIGRDKRRYHHILDPKTGYPADAGLISATVVSDCSMDADALSTILFVLGMEKGLCMLRSFPGVGAVFVDKDLKVFITGLSESFQAADGMDFQIVS